VPGPLDRVAQRMHPGDVHFGPAAERPLADPLPERAGGEPGAATAAFVVQDVPLPQVDDLAQGADRRQLAEETLDERGSASS
jgi:hypothetical protein